MITLEQAQEFLNIKSTEKDEWLETLISASGKMIQDFIGFDLTATEDDTDKTASGFGADFIRLPGPLSELSAIEIDGTTYNTTDFFINESYLEAYNPDFSFPVGKKNVTITGTWGYTTWPDELLVAQRLLVAWLYQKNKDEISVLTRTTQGQSTTFIQDIPQAISIILQNFKASVI